MRPAEKRRFPLEGLLNTRELGGYPVTIDGKQKTVKKGLLYRSGSPENATKADYMFLESKKIRTIVDFRSEEEKTAAFHFSSVVKKVDLPIDAGNLMGALLKTGKWLYTNDTERAEAEMLSLYTVMPIEAISRYRVLFSLLAESDAAPLLYYCSAGKDRTGLASALILYALGADRKTIMEDYVYSNENLRLYWERFVVTQPFLVPYYTVSETYLQAAFTSIEEYAEKHGEMHGGIDWYLSHELGVDIKRLRDLYVE